MRAGRTILIFFEPKNKKMSWVAIERDSETREVVCVILLDS